MIRFYYECNLDLRNSSVHNDTVIKPYICTPDKYCIYCCCDNQCCLLAQKRPPRHLWETWYFWLGIALLAVFIVSSVSSYIVNNYRHNIQGVPFRHSSRVDNNERNDRLNHDEENQHEVSISIIPAAGLLPPDKKVFVIATQPNDTHMTPVVA